jgi:steroid delta-isomerase-like uncharacterized protein
MHTVEKWLDAVNQHDLVALMECYAENALNHQVADPQGLHYEAAAIRAGFEELWQAFPGIRMRPLHVHQADEHVIIEWVRDATFSGRDFRGHSPTGKRCENLLGCEVFHILDGKIYMERGYWNRARWCEALGLPL